MSKDPCELIKDLIPLYIKYDLSDADKEIVENHLKDCKDCCTFAEEYSKYNLKLEHHTEDFPQGNTSKKCIEKLKVWVIITVVAAISAIIAIGTIGYKMGEEPKNDLLTLKTIVRTFEKQGLVLKEDNSKSPEDFQLSGAKPAIFGLGDKRGTLLVYTFKSFVEREDIVEKTNKFNNSYDLLEYPFNAKNAFLVYIAPPNPTTEENMRTIGETRMLISNIVFENLNQGKKIIYKGESASWEGTFTLKYYENWWQDETGKLQYESYHEDIPVVRYKLADKDAVGTIAFEYKTTGSGGKSTGAKLNKEGYLYSGRSGGTGAMPREKDKINFTLTWDGKEESMVLVSE